MISYTNYTKGVDIMKAPKGKYAWTATVGEKGQIVIPKQARDVFEIKPGDTLLLLGDEKRGIAIPPKGAFAELFGMAFEEKEDDEEL
jgi:AbrB family looped-hinge helix DNA binding protein